MEDRKREKEKCEKNSNHYDNRKEKHLNADHTVTSRTTIKCRAKCIAPQLAEKHFNRILYAYS